MTRIVEQLPCYADSPDGNTAVGSHALENNTTGDHNMIVWAGFNQVNPVSSINTGGKYNPSTDSWLATTTTTAPAARQAHTAVWTGSEMIVWGGLDFSSGFFNSGGKYSPGADSWAATSTHQCAGRPRASHCSVDWQRNDCLGWLW